MLSLFVEIPIGPKLQGLTSYGTQANALGLLVTNLIDILIIVAVITSLFYIIIGAINWITGGDDKAEIEQARHRITNAILGLIISVAAWSLWILIVKNFLGIDIEGGVTIGG